MTLSPQDYGEAKRWIVEGEGVGGAIFSFGPSHLKFFKAKILIIISWHLDLNAKLFSFFHVEILAFYFSIIIFSDYQIQKVDVALD